MTAPADTPDARDVIRDATFCAGQYLAEAVIATAEAVRRGALVWVELRRAWAGFRAACEPEDDD